MATKLYDMTVKTGEYPDGQGGMKGRYENIGSMMQGDNGPFLILKRTFNPAGVPNPDNKDSVIVSLFESNSQQGGQNQQSTQQQNYGYQQNNQPPQQQQQKQQQQQHNQQQGYQR